MPRVSILDSILNRPSQSYAPPDIIQDDTRRRVKGQWAAPTDLPGAPRAPSSIMSGGDMFRKRDNRNTSMMGSDAGASVAGSTTSRFGRSRRYSQQPGDSTMNTIDTGSQYAPSSIADGSTSRKKNHWWEAGSMNFGRQSRAPSVAGDSVFSEPPDRPIGSANQWAGIAGVGAGGDTNRSRVARSDYGGVNTRNSHSLVIPPVPRVDNRYLNGAPPPGRLQSNVAPLGFSSINPSLTAKPSKQRLDTMNNRSQAGVKRSNSNSGRIMSPPASIQGMSSPPGSQIMLPPNRVSSPPLRPQSPAMSESGRSVRSSGSNMQGRAQEWRDFVQSMSNSDISKTWQSSQNNVSNIDAALQKTIATNTIERRKSNVVRLQKELQQEAQYEQVVRDPGIIHQDLLARAASQIVGPPPANRHGDADLLGAPSLRPGSVLLPANGIERVRSPPVQPQYQQQQQSQPQQQQYYQQQPVPNHPLYAPQQAAAATAAIYHQSGSMSPPTRTMSPPARMMSPVSSPPMSPSSRPRTVLSPISLTRSQNPLPSSIPVPPIVPMPVTQIQESSEEDSSSEEESEEEQSVQTSGNKTTEDTSEEVSEEEDEEEVDSDDSEESRRRLEAVNEEDEEASSVGHEMRAQRTTLNTASNASKYKAFETALKSNTVASKGIETPAVKGHVSPAQGEVAITEIPPRLSAYQLQPIAKEAEPVSESQDALLATAKPVAEVIHQQNAPENGIKVESLAVAADDATHSSTEQLPKLEGDLQTLAVERGAVSDIEDTARQDQTQDIREVALPIAQQEVAEESQIGNGLGLVAPPVLEDSHSSKSHDRSEAHSVRTIQTGKGIVTSDAAIKSDDRKSIDSNATASKLKSTQGSLRNGAGSRQHLSPTRLSNDRLGANSSALRSASRASSRGIFSPDSEAVSTRSDSDDEHDDDLKERINDEQKRLRSMKVGDNFFGGSFSSLLDKFGVADHDAVEANAGSSSTPLITKEGEPITDQELYTINAQENINEVRRLRAESPATTRGKRDSDVMTTTSAIAPSFAAVWLLNQQMDGSPRQATTPDSASALVAADPVPLVATQPAPEPSSPLNSAEGTLTSAPDTAAASGRGHARQMSNASSKDSVSNTPVSTTSRFRSFFGGGSSNSNSVTDRPRQKKSKGKEEKGSITIPINDVS